MVEVALVQFRFAQKRLWVLALQGGGDLVNLAASEAGGSLELAALVVGELHSCFLKVGAEAPGWFKCFLSGCRLIFLY